ncbi:MAG TPA: class I SAM-dependent methyltransferase [Kribbellaceae bacterium]|jgi:SAM-dependent methyltransferase
MSAVPFVTRSTRSTLRTLRRAAGRARGTLHRTLSAVGVRQSEAKISSDSQRYWSETDGGRWKSDSHWRNADVFADNDIWSRIGQRHLEMVERGARMVGFSGTWRRILEWGCGGGSNAVQFAPRAAEFIGVDVVDDSLDECAKQVAAVCDTPFIPILIDVAEPEKAVAAVGAPCEVFLCCYVFELIPTQEYGERLLRIAAQLLSPDGLALIQIKYDEGRWATKPRRRAYRSGLADMTTYPIAAFWQLAVSCGLTPRYVELVPRDELDERYAYFLLTRTAQRGT